MRIDRCPIHPISDPNPVVDVPEFPVYHVSNTADNRQACSEDRALGEQCFRVHLAVKVDSPVLAIAQGSYLDCADPRVIRNVAIDPVHNLEVMMMWYACLVDPCTRAGDQ